MENYTKEMSPRIKQLHNDLIERSLSDRTSEWFRTDMFPKLEEIDYTDYDLDSKLENQTILVRRGVAIDIMLQKMTDKSISKLTHTAEIQDGDLLLGVLPMGSNGLGKVFPQYMTEDELRAGSITNRNTGSLFGHNTLDYKDLLEKGLRSVINECDEKMSIGYQENENDGFELLNSLRRKQTYNDFYLGVKISCQAVIKYANAFADIAAEKALTYPVEHERRKELENMARIARQVPEFPATNFYEAMQSITFFHIALHSSMNFISLGRLDQVLSPYLEQEKDKNKAIEIFECFLIKLAGRLNLSPKYLVSQDHVDYATVLGTHPYYIDQKAGVNNFLQNIIIGGKKPDGSDATNEATYMILQAFQNVNLSTPGIYVRMHKDTPDDLKKAVSHSIKETNNPAILNDEVMIPAMYNALKGKMKRVPFQIPEPIALKPDRFLELARDYCVDGCWEPILNGESDWTFTMLNAMSAMEAAMNQGAGLSHDDELFRGAKIAPTTRIPTNYEELINNFKTQLEFFVDQCVMSMYIYYGIDEYAAPSPLMSAFMKGCMERGRDKAWGGANYNLGGVIYGGIPNVVNSLAALKKHVFSDSRERNFTLKQVNAAIWNNFGYKEDGTENMDLDEGTRNLYKQIENEFNNNTQKFGNNDREVNEITKQVTNICYEAVQKSAEFGKMVFENRVEPDTEEWKRIIALRNLAGYFGVSLSEKYGDFNMHFTVGFGTFEQYNWQGRSIGASVDRRSGNPIAPNFTPVPGTTSKGAVGVIESFRDLELNRFAGGVITDLCVEHKEATDSTLLNLLNSAIEGGMPMMTVSVEGEDKYKYTEIYNAVIKANKMTDKEAANEMLKQYAGVNVRIGGWQTPFITLPISHMENYINRPVSF